MPRVKPISIRRWRFSGGSVTATTRPCCPALSSARLLIGSIQRLDQNHRCELRAERDAHAAHAADHRAAVGDLANFDVFAKAHLAQAQARGRLGMDFADAHALSAWDGAQAREGAGIEIESHLRPRTIDGFAPLGKRRKTAFQAVSSSGLPACNARSTQAGSPLDATGRMPVLRPAAF